MTVAQWIRGLPVGVVQAIKGAYDYPSSVGLTALGNSQGTALSLPRDFNVFTTVGASTGGILPWGADQTPTGGVSGVDRGLVEIGDSITVVNRGSNALSIYPQSGGNVQNGGANTAFSVAANKVAQFFYVGGGNFNVNLSA